MTPRRHTAILTTKSGRRITVRLRDGWWHVVDADTGMLLSTPQATPRMAAEIAQGIAERPAP